MNLEDWELSRKVAAHFGCDHETVYKLGKAGNFLVAKFAGKWIVNIPSFKKYLLELTGENKPLTPDEIELMKLEQRLREA